MLTDVVDTRCIRCGRPKSHGLFPYCDECEICPDCNGRPELVGFCALCQNKGWILIREARERRNEEVPTTL